MAWFKIGRYASDAPKEEPAAVEQPVAPVEQTDEEWAGPEAIMGKPVPIKVGTLQAEVFNFYSMPGELVTDVISTPGQAQIPKSINLFKLAFKDPKQLEELEALSFEQLAEAIEQWMAGSSSGGMR